MNTLVVAWQICAGISSVFATIIMVTIYVRCPRTRKHPGPVLMCIFLSTSIANITRVILFLLIGGNDANINSPTLSSVANQQLLGLNQSPANESLGIIWTFWVGFFFLTASTMWFLMLALDLIFSLSNPFLPFNVDNLKHHVFAWPVSFLYCGVFHSLIRGGYSEIGSSNNKHQVENTRSQHVLLYLHLPSYIVLVYIIVALVAAWKKTRRLEGHTHQTTRQMTKLILPYLGVFALDTILTLSLYLRRISNNQNREYSAAASALDQLALVLLSVIIFILFCRDFGVFQALSRDSGGSARWMENMQPLNDLHDNITVDEDLDGCLLRTGAFIHQTDSDNISHRTNPNTPPVEQLDFSNKLRMDIMRYMSRGIMKSLSQRLQGSEEELVYCMEDMMTDIVFDDYNQVDSFGVVYHGIYDGGMLEFRDCAPKVFHQIRSHFGVQPQFYKDSFDLEKILTEHGSEGLSGNIFYFTSNMQFMVKSVPKNEFDTLRAILPHYHRYVMSNPDTLLCRYFGCHSIELPVGKRRMYFVVMQNLFNCGKVQQRFDLKGNCDRRQAVNANQVESYIQLAREQRLISKLMMDIDFLKFSGGVIVSPSMSERLKTQLCEDIVFLASRGIIDYSILLGVQYVEKISENGKSACPSPNGNRLGGFPSLNQEKVYFIGIVDMLQQYNWRWTVQRWFLGLLLCKDVHDVSAVPPDEYATRITDFVRTRMFESSLSTPGSRRASTDRHPVFRCSANKLSLNQSMQSSLHMIDGQGIDIRPSDSFRVLGMDGRMERHRSVDVEKCPCIPSCQDAHSFHPSACMRALDFSSLDSSSILHRTSSSLPSVGYSSVALSPTQSQLSSQMSWREDERNDTQTPWEPRNTAPSELMQYRR